MPINEDDIEISTFRSGGPGGQHKNVTESAVRVRHLPTGIVVVSTASRSQHRNKQLALEELERRIEILNRPRKRRIPTKPTHASRARRLDEKGHRSRIKQNRRPPSDEN